MYILLGILVVVGGVLALTLPAKGKWQAAQESAKAALEAGEGEPPEVLMKAIGKTHMVKEDKDGLTQVYRWSGGIKTYELKLKFVQLYQDKEGIYGFPTEVIATAKPFFMTDSLEGYAEAHEKTGSTYAKLAELEVADPFSKSGKKGGGARGTGQGGAPKKKGLSFRPPSPPRELNLNDDQRAQWRAATAKMTETSKGIFDGTTPRAELTKKMQEMNAAYQEALKSFLTPEQLAKYAEIKSRRTSVGGSFNPTGKGGGLTGGGRPGGGRTGGGFGRSSGPPEELKLTEEQKTKWTAASNAMREKMRGIFSSGISREEMGAKMTEIRDEFQAELKKFLTEEQTKKYQEIRSQRPERKKGGGGTGQRPPGPGQGRPGDGKL
jgi:Spy/CpxP family protein refolding chaperone